MSTNAVAVRLVYLQLSMYCVLAQVMYCEFLNCKRPKGMRYEMQKRWFWGAIIFMCCATGAFAETDSFTLTGVTQSGNNMGGVYTSPYVATINNTQSGVSVICDDFADDVEVGESWTVLSTNLSGLSQSTSANSADTFLKWDTSSTAAAQVQDYMTVAILSAQLLSIDSSTTEAADLSFAI